MKAPDFFQSLLLRLLSGTRDGDGRAMLPSPEVSVSRGMYSSIGQSVKTKGATTRGKVLVALSPDAARYPLCRRLWVVKSKGLALVAWPGKA